MSLDICVNFANQISLVVEMKTPAVEKIISIETKQKKKVWEENSRERFVEFLVHSILKYKIELHNQPKTKSEENNVTITFSENLLHSDIYINLEFD